MNHDEINQNEKTLVFCATQDHALAVRDLINQLVFGRLVKAPSVLQLISCVYPLCYTLKTEWGFIFLRCCTIEELMERESLEMDVVFVGAGPANLSGALHLARLVAEHNQKAGGRRQKPWRDSNRRHRKGRDSRRTHSFRRRDGSARPG